MNKLFLAFVVHFYSELNAQCNAPLPVLSIADNEFCETEGPNSLEVNVNEEVGVDYSYTWYATYAGSSDEVIIKSGKTPLLVNRTGVYKVKVTANNCAQEGTASKSIVVHTMPVVDAGPDIRIEYGQQGHLDGSVFGDYEVLEWSPVLPGLSPNQPSGTFTAYQKDTIITMTLKATNVMCISADFVTVIIRGRISKDDHILDVKPTVVHSKTQVDVGRKGTLAIYNLNGVLLYEENVELGIREVDFTTFDNGQYYYIVLAEGDMFYDYVKVIKQL